MISDDGNGNDNDRQIEIMKGDKSGEATSLSEGAE